MVECGVVKRNVGENVIQIPLLINDKNEVAL